MNKPRTLYFDDITFENLEKLAKFKNVSKSAIARMIINELCDDIFEGDHKDSKLSLIGR